MYLIIKNIHVAFATLTIIGFLLRAYWKAGGSKLHQNRATKIVPHTIDALFLATGIWLITMLDMNKPRELHTMLLGNDRKLTTYEDAITGETFGVMAEQGRRARVVGG